MVHIYSKFNNHDSQVNMTTVDTVTNKHTVVTINTPITKTAVPTTAADKTNDSDSVVLLWQDAIHKNYLRHRC